MVKHALTAIWAIAAYQKFRKCLSLIGCIVKRQNATKMGRIALYGVALTTTVTHADD